MGRRKLYDPEQARDALAGVFWERGYEGSSLGDLEQATGLPKQSLYREFGDKRAMYLAALSSYERAELHAATKILSRHSDPVEGFAALFETVISKIESEKDRRGCFLCNAASDRTTIDPVIDSHVQKAMERLLAVFARPMGDLPGGGANARVLLAGYVGMRVLARSGMPAHDLREIADRLLHSLRLPK